MKLMNHITWFSRCEDGVVEGTGTWNYGPRSTPKCAHCTCFTNEWVIKILLHITYAGQCPPARVHDKILGSWFRHVRPSRWILGDYFRGYIFHYRSVMTRISSQFGGHRQRWWPSECPKLHWYILRTRYPKERESHPYCTHMWFSSIGIDKYHSENGSSSLHLTTRN